MQEWMGNEENRLTPGNLLFGNFLFAGKSGQMPPIKIISGDGRVLGCPARFTPQVITYLETNWTQCRVYHGYQKKS